MMTISSWYIGQGDLAVVDVVDGRFRDGVCYRDIGTGSNKMTVGVVESYAHYGDWDRRSGNTDHVTGRGPPVVSTTVVDDQE